VIIRISLLLFFASIFFFIGLVLLLRLAVPNLPELMMQLGSVLLLSAYALLLLAAAVAVFFIILRTLAHYFSTPQRLLRRVHYNLSKQEQISRLFHFKAVQIKYSNELKKDSLLKANNRRQLRALTKSIQKELLLIKKDISAANFNGLQKELTSYHSRQDIDALLKLQRRITNIG